MKREARSRGLASFFVKPSFDIRRDQVPLGRRDLNESLGPHWRTDISLSSCFSYDGIYISIGAPGDTSSLRPSALVIPKEGRPGERTAAEKSLIRYV